MRTKLAQLYKDLLAYIEKDALTYGGMLATYRLPESTSAEMEHRQAKIQEVALVFHCDENHSGL
jgi:formiminotetrahydrofolate cyclodeaminase